MADATTAARDRIDRAFAALEARVRALKNSSTQAIADDDLFAAGPADSGRVERLTDRIAELEAAGHAASEALGEAAALIRGLASASIPKSEDADDADRDTDGKDDL